MRPAVRDRLLEPLQPSADAGEIGLAKQLASSPATPLSALSRVLPENSLTGTSLKGSCLQ